MKEAATSPSGGDNSSFTCAPHKGKSYPTAARCPAYRPPATWRWTAYGLAHPQNMRDLKVELSTPSGLLFTATASSIDVRTEDGSVHITAREQSYLSSIHATEITLQTADGPCVFVLENAVAGLKGRTFTALAQSIRRIEPERCVVCQKATDHGGGMCRIKVEDAMIALCCPLCIEAFNKEPKRYLVLRQLNKANTPKRKDTPTSFL